QILAAPKEGDTMLVVNATPTTATDMYSVQVFVNGELQTLIDGSGNTTQSIPTTATGTTQVLLKNPLGDGQVVQVVQIETGTAPHFNVAGGMVAGPGPMDAYGKSEPSSVESWFNFGRVRAH